MLWTFNDHLIQFFSMAAMLLGSQAYSRSVQKSRLRGEAVRLSNVLIISLSAIGKLYSENLSSLAAHKSTLVSARTLITLLRTQLGRITILDLRDGDAVMASVIAAEQAETWMEIAGRKNGAAAFEIQAKCGDRRTLESMLREAVQLCAVAEQILESTRDVTRRSGLESSLHRDAVLQDPHAEKVRIDFSGAADQTRGSSETLHSTPKRRVA